MKRILFLLIFIFFIYFFYSSPTKSFALLEVTCPASGPTAGTGICENDTSIPCPGGTTDTHEFCGVVGSQAGSPHCCTQDNPPPAGGGGGGGGGGSGTGDWGDPNSGPSLYSISNILGGGAPNNAPTSSYEALIRLFLGILIVASIVLFVVFFIWGGISWIMSGGDKQKLQSSKQKLTFSIIGLVVVFTAVIIINFLFTFLEGI